jgi:hypothetical protein
MKKILIVLALIAALAFLIPSVVLATDITITATPSYVSFSSSPTTWTLNGITGSGKIAVNTKYYANPLGDTTAPSITVVDGECQFTWTNDSSINIVITVNCGAFTGGDATMTNSNTGSNGATTYGAYSWYSGQTYANKVITKSSGSAALYTTVTPGEDKKWGAEILTRTDAWTGGGASTATMTISAAAA